MSLKTISRLCDVLTPGNTREALLGWYNATQFETDKTYKRGYNLAVNLLKSKLFKNIKKLLP